MSVNAKIWAICLACFVVIFAGSLPAFWAAWRTRVTLEAPSTVVSSDVLNALWSAGNTSFSAAYGMIEENAPTEGGTLIETDPATGELGRQTQDMMQQFATYSAADAEIVREMAAVSNSLKQMVSQLADRTASAPFALQDFADQLDLLWTDYHRLLQSAVSETSAQTATQIQTAHTQNMLALTTLVSGIATCLFACIAAAILLNRTIKRPIRLLSKKILNALPKDQAATAPRDDYLRLAHAVQALKDLLDVQSQGTVEVREHANESERRFRDFARVASDWLWETDAEGRVSFCSGRFEKLTGIPSDELIGLPFTDFMQTLSPDDTQRQVEVTSRRPIRNLTCEYALDGMKPRFCRLSGQPIIDKAGTFHGYRGVASDITDEIAAIKHAKHAALHDALTDLPNRGMVYERVSQALAARQMTGGSVAAIIIDLDYFSETMDTYGPKVCDLLLIEVADRLRKTAGANDTVGRLSGDEFVIVQNVREAPGDCEALCLAIQQSLSKPFYVMEETYKLSASLGIAIAEEQEESEADLLRNANMAMSQAKLDGRNTYRFHDDGMNSKLKKRIQVAMELRTAIAKNAMEVYYQPIYKATEPTIVGFEALSRWPSDTQGMVSPADYIAVAEDTGLIIPLGEQILRYACREAMCWPGKRLAVNISPVQFLDEAFLSLVSKILRETCLPAHLLEIEITEAALFEHHDTALFRLDALKELGVKLVLDDFGTGYSSLSYLQKFRFDKIKIDRNFIANIQTDEASAEIVKALISLGNTLGIETTAEGVETEGQLNFLKEHGCDQVQGRLLGKPRPSGDAFALLRKHGVLPGAPRASKIL